MSAGARRFALLAAIALVAFAAAYVLTRAADDDAAGEPGAAPALSEPARAPATRDLDPITLPAAIAREGGTSRAPDEPAAEEPETSQPSGGGGFAGGGGGGGGGGTTCSSAAPATT
jgi:hypothetical protein